MNAEIQMQSSEVICQESDLVASSGVAALFKGEQIALFYLPDEDSQKIYVVGNYDPLGRANVISRGIVGDVKGEPVVASPLYKQHFSLITGRCIENDDVSLPVYRAELLAGEVIVHGLILP